MLLVYDAVTEWEPAFSDGSDAVATPFTRSAFTVALSTVKVTVPAGVMEMPVTVAVTVML